MKSYDLLIDGKNVPSQNGKYFDAVNPSTGEVIARLADASTEDVNLAVIAARQNFEEISLKEQWSLESRCRDLRAIAELIREHAKELADLESLDTGKTIKQTTFIDVPTAADTFEYFSGQKHVLNDEEIKTIAPVKCISRREPIGVVAAIIPWNYPLIMAAWKLAPALLCGNSVILKPSPLASLSLVRLARLIADAGLCKGFLSVVTSSRPQAGAELAAHPQVDMVSFSGGSKTGQDVMRVASETTKNLVLELGGKSANIIFNDADIDAAIGGALTAIFMNQGQMCTAGSRLMVHESIYDTVVTKLSERAQSLVIGNALDFQTEFGPVISRQQRDQLLALIEKGEKEGARILCGGQIPDNPELSQGYFLQPTIFVDVRNSMTIAQEELFGPVLCVLKFTTEEEAIRLANETKYGLAAMVWTKDLAKANRVAGHLRCGTVWINTYGAFHNEIPFGGYKRSGFGRELGKEGILEFTQSKQMVTDQTPGGKPLVSAWF